MKSSQFKSSSWLRRLAVPRIDLIYMVLLAVGTFTLYAATAVPGPFDGDYGEFQYMPRLLGLPHPTGYPIYLLLGWFWSWLPLGTMAFRLNLFSAFWATLTLLLLFAIGRQQKLQPLAALAGGLALAFVPAFWRYAGLAAVYTLHTALMAAALLLWLYWSAALRQKTSETSKRLWMAAFFTGLALTNHPTAAFLVPAAALFVLLHLRRIRSADAAVLERVPDREDREAQMGEFRSLNAAKQPNLAYASPSGALGVRDWLLGAGFFALPGLLYLYVPLRLWMIGPGLESFGLRESIAKGRIAPFVDWSLQSVVEYITGRSLLNNYDLKVNLLWESLPELLGQQFGWPLMLLGAIGMGVWLWRQPRSWLLLITLFLPAAAYAVTYDADFTERGEIAHLEGHLMPALLVFALWVAQGVNTLQQTSLLILKRVEQASLLGAAKDLSKGLSAALIALLLLLVLGLQLWDREIPTAADSQQSDSIRAYWTEVLTYPLEMEAALTGHWGDLTAFWYFQHGEGLRPDLWAIFPPNIPQIESWLNESARPLYLAGPLLDWSAELSQRYNLTPWGILVRIAPQDQPPTFPPMQVRSALFGDQLQLEGYDVVSLAPNRQQLWLTWHTIAPTSRDLSVSVRLHAPDGTMLHQHDGRLASLWYPDGTMPAQQPLLTVFDLELPDNLPPDTVVQIVVYDPQTILPLLTTEGQDLFELGPFQP